MSAGNGRMFARPGDLARKHEITEPAPQQPAQVYAEQLAELGAVIGDLRGALRALVPVVLSSETVILDQFGTATRNYHLPYRSIAITSYSAASLTIAPSPLGPGAPPSGPGVAVVGARSFRVCNMDGYAWSIYGGAPGDVVTIETYARPQPPNVGPAMAAAVTAAGLITTTGQPLAPQTTLVNFGTATAPAANQTIAVITAPAPGTYNVTALLEVSGTVTASEQDNINLVVNAVNLSRLPLFAGAAAGGPPQPVTVPGITVPAGNIAVQARAAGGVAAVYSVLVTATRVA